MALLDFLDNPIMGGSKAQSAGVGLDFGVEGSQALANANKGFTFRDILNLMGSLSQGGGGIVSSPFGQVNTNQNTSRQVIAADRLFALPRVEQQDSTSQDIGDMGQLLQVIGAFYGGG